MGAPSAAAPARAFVACVALVACEADPPPEADATAQHAPLPFCGAEPASWATVLGASDLGRSSNGIVSENAPAEIWRLSATFVVTGPVLDGCGHVAAADGKRLVVLDAGGDVVWERAVEVGQSSIAIDAQSRLWAADYDGQVWVWGRGETPDFTLTCDTFAESLAPGPDGTMALKCGNALQVIAPDGSFLSRTEDAGPTEMVLEPPAWADTHWAWATTRGITFLPVTSGQPIHRVPWPETDEGLIAAVSAPLARAPGTAWVATAGGEILTASATADSAEVHPVEAVWQLFGLASVPESGTILALHRRGHLVLDEWGAVLASYEQDAASPTDAFDPVAAVDSRGTIVRVWAQKTPTFSEERFLTGTAADGQEVWRVRLDLEKAATGLGIAHDGTLVVATVGALVALR